MSYCYNLSITDQDCLKRVRTQLEAHLQTRPATPEEVDVILDALEGPGIPLEGSDCVIRHPADGRILVSWPANRPQPSPANWLDDPVESWEETKKNLEAGVRFYEERVAASQ